MEQESFKGYDVFNIGTGKGTSVLEIVNAFERTTGVKFAWAIGPRRGGDVEQVWGDVTKSENVLKWRAELDVDTMMASAWKWEKAIAEKPL